MAVTCAISDCGRSHYAHTWCSLHYKRWLAHGDPLFTLKPRYSSAIEHFRHYMPGDPPHAPSPTAGCWLWTGPVQHGYGVLAHAGRNIKASRLAYQIFCGPLTADALIRHTCDNPPCVQPAHLIPGTDLDNKRDNVERGRQGGGGAPKLTPDAVRAIRARYAAGGITQPALALEHGVTLNSIENLLSRRTWASVQ